MTDILLKVISNTINSHVKDDKKAKDIMTKFEKIITQQLSEKDVDLVYNIKSPANCCENDGDEYNESISMTKKEHDLIDNLFKKHKFTIVERDFSSGGHGCVLSFDPNEMWKNKSIGGNYDAIVPIKESNFIELLERSLRYDVYPERIRRMQLDPKHVNNTIGKLLKKIDEFKNS